MVAAQEVRWWAFYVRKYIVWRAVPALGVEKH